MATEEFKRKNSEVDVLFTSTELGNLGQNMQGNCCDCIFPDTWSSAPNGSQCPGRVESLTLHF